MRNKHLACWCAGLVTMSMALGTCAWAKIPNADNPNAYTERDHALERLDYNRRTLVDTYQAVGKRDPKWDAQAIAFLEGMAKRFTCADVEPFYRPIEPPSEAELKKLGLAAIDAGCPDAMVLCCYAAILDDAGEVNDARTFLSRAATAFNGSKYPPHRVMTCFVRLQRHLNKARGPEPYERCERAITELSAMAMIWGDLPKLHRRFVFESVWDVLKAGPIERIKKVYELAQKQKNADPWMLEMLGGEYHVKAGWALRGSGVAVNVTPEGWRGLELNLREARQHFTKAIELEATYPEAATGMIAVAMASENPPGETVRAWFDRATAAQFDYAPAYVALMWAIRPRWGGSHNEMYRFGAECLETKRFDTAVPYRIMTALEQIRSEMGGDFSYWKRAGAYESIGKCLQGYLEKSGGKQTVLRARHAAIAWRLAHFEEAKKLLEGLEGSVVDFEIAQFGESAPLALSQVSVMTGPHAAALKQAETAAERQDFDSASKAYGEVAANLQQDDPSALFVRTRLATLGIEKSFAAGEWIDLKPASGLGWHLVNGQFKLESDGTLVATTDERGFLMVCHAHFGTRYELEAKLEVTPAEDDPLAAGPVVLYTSEEYQRGLLIQRAGHQFVVHHRAKIGGAYPAESDPTCVIGAEVKDGVLIPRLNGTKVVEAYPASAELPWADAHVGLCARWGAPGQTVKFISVRIRKLP